MDIDIAACVQIRMVIWHTGGLERDFHIPGLFYVIFGWFED